MAVPRTEESRQDETLVNEQWRFRVWVEQPIKEIFSSFEEKSFLTSFSITSRVCSVDSRGFANGWLISPGEPPPENLKKGDYGFQQSH